jgi:hypothetical protein
MTDQPKKSHPDQAAKDYVMLTTRIVALENIVKGEIRARFRRENTPEAFEANEEKIDQSIARHFQSMLESVRSEILVILGDDPTLDKGFVSRLDTRPIPGLENEP